MEIKDKYIDKNGKIYDIRNVNFDINESRFNFGKFVAETTKDNIIFFGGEDYNIDGVEIYQTSYDPKIALRIYKDWAAYKLAAKYNVLSQSTGHEEEKIVSELKERQKDIKLTEFPTGIVTMNNIIIGQEIPYYEGHIDLSKEIVKLLKNIKDDISYNKNIQMIMYYYQKIINILEELTKNNIYYEDLHPKNFVVKEASIKLIDFEQSKVKFNYTNKEIENYIKTVRELFCVINKQLKVDFTVEGNSFVEMREDLLIKSKSLK